VSASVGAWLGLAAASGLLLVLARLPWLHPVRLQDRVLPYLRDLPAGGATGRVRLAGPSSQDRGRTFGDLLARCRADLAGRLDRALGGAATIRRRLDQLGGGSVEEFRTQQVVWGSAAVAVMLGLGLVRTAAGAPPQPFVLALLAGSSGVLGVVGCDRQLSRRAALVRRRVLVQLPAVAELVALAVAAGEGPAAALDRVSRIGSGELARELGRVMSDVRAGAPLAHALDVFAIRCDVTVVRRFADAIVVALERGTPLAAVLRAQAADARDAARRELVESAARREVLMMLPVVFLVLPVSVLFALFPGFWGLSLTA